MQKSFIPFLVLLFLSIGLHSQNTIIIGNASGAEGLRIRLNTLSDYISELPAKLDESMIDSIGNFKLKIAINETILAQLQIDIYKGDIFLEPGKTYNITLNPLNYKEEIKESPFLNRKKLEIVFKNQDTNELNQQISRFNGLYDDFLIDNAGSFLRNKTTKAKIDSFQLKSNALFSASKNAYLNNYIKYRIAGLEQSGRVKNTSKLFTSYIRNQTVLYNHVEYMFFFNQFYEKFIFNGKHNLKKDDFSRLINSEKNYISLLDSIGKDSLVKNEVIRELVFLKGMKELFYSNAFNNDNIIDMLKKFSLKTKFKTHKLIAQNLITSFNILRIGTKPPDFNLKSVKDETFSLKSFEGKYTYIGFFTTWCAGCMIENEAITDLYKKHGNTINFVSISADKQQLSLRYFLEKHKYNWVFLHSGNDNELLEKYGVLTYPVFLLLDPQGNIVNYPALKPSEGIENEFNLLLKKEDEIPKE
jgi:peroxiredoxin